MDSYSAKTTMKLGSSELRIASLMALEKQGWSLGRLPFSMRILLENLLRREDGAAVTAEDIEAVATWDPQVQPAVEIAFMPARVLLQELPHPVEDQGTPDQPQGVHLQLIQLLL